MRKLLIVLALLLPLSARGQTLSGRASVGADYKITKGLHLGVEEEIRSADDFSALGSLRTTLSLSWKPSKYVKLGVGGVLINPYKTDKTIELASGDISYDGFWAPRYRLYGDVGGSLQWGDFHFNLKERLQLTHNADATMNTYQSPRNKLALKSRVGIKYKRWKKVEPSLSFEIRTALNDPWGTTSGGQQASESGKTYYNYQHAGYTHVYNNRYRGNIGLDIQPSKRHSFSPYVLLDYITEYELDTNKAGTRLYSANYVDAFAICIGLSYVYNF